MRTVRFVSQFIVFAVAVALLFASCSGEFLLPVDESGFVYVPDGWKVKREGAYSSLDWDPGFFIDENGTNIVFSTEDGSCVELSMGDELGLVPDGVSVEFFPSVVELTLGELVLVFEKMG